MESRVDLDLVLNECAHFVGPIDAAANALLHGEGLRRSEVCGRVDGVVGQRGVGERAEAVGVVVDGAPAELRELDAEANVVATVAPGYNLIGVDGVFGAGTVCLRAAAGEEPVDLDSAGIGNAVGYILILLKSNEQLVDEGGRDDDAIVEDEVIFAETGIGAGLRKDERADA